MDNWSGFAKIPFSSRLRRSRRRLERDELLLPFTFGDSLWLLHRSRPGRDQSSSLSPLVIAKGKNRRDESFLLKRRWARLYSTFPFRCRMEGFVFSFTKSEKRRELSSGQEEKLIEFSFLEKVEIYRFYAL